MNTAKYKYLKVKALSGPIFFLGEGRDLPSAYKRYFATCVCFRVPHRQNHLQFNFLGDFAGGSLLFDNSP